MPWRHVLISNFGGPEVLHMTEESTIPDPGPGEVRIKVLAAGTGFTDTMIRRGRYPDFKGPLPFTSWLRDRRRRREDGVRRNCRDGRSDGR